MNLKDDVESIENTAKNELDEDERRKQSELVNLGYLTEVPQGRAVQKDIPNYAIEIGAIDEKVKAECLKIYTGEFAKQLNSTIKIPNSLISFLQNLKIEMENFRLKCVRDLRTFVRIYNIIYN